MFLVNIWLEYDDGLGVRSVTAKQNGETKWHTINMVNEVNKSIHI